MTNILHLHEVETDHTRAAQLALSPTIIVCGMTREPRYSHDTSAGKLYATTTCRVVFESSLGPIVMTSEQCKELSDALRSCKAAVDRWDRKRRGELDRKITVVDGVATMHYNGLEMLLKLKRSRSHGPRAQYCDQCRTEQEWYWLSYRVTDKGWGPRKRVGECRICRECFPKLVVDPERNLAVICGGK